MLSARSTRIYRSTDVPLVFIGWLSLKETGKDPLSYGRFRETAKTAYKHAIKFHHKLYGGENDPLNILKYYMDDRLQEEGKDRLTHSLGRGLKLEQRFASKNDYLAAVKQFHTAIGFDK